MTYLTIPNVPLPNNLITSKSLVVRFVQSFIVFWPSIMAVGSVADDFDEGWLNVDLTTSTPS